MLNVDGFFELSAAYTKRVRAARKSRTTVSKDLEGSEFREQVKLVVWLEKNRSRLGIKFYSIPNGGYRTPTEAVKLKRTGVSPGVPDLCIPKPKGRHHGLYIELKRVSGGKVSNFQQEWIDYLNGEGYYAKVCNGFEEAKKIIEYYFSL